jgi:hypothetical protein
LPFFALELGSGIVMLIWRNLVTRIIERLIDVSDDHANSLDPTSP